MISRSAVVQCKNEGQIVYNDQVLTVREFIAQSYLAQGFTPEFIDQVAWMSEIRTYAAGSAILNEDESTADLFILAEGKLEIKTAGGDSIGFIKPPMPFGEVSFLDRKRRSSSVIAIEDSKVVFIPEEPLRQLLRENPEMAVRALVNLSVLLCDRLRKANQQIAALNAIEESNI